MSLSTSQENGMSLRSGFGSALNGCDKAEQSQAVWVGNSESCWTPRLLILNGIFLVAEFNVKFQEMTTVIFRKSRTYDYLLKKGFCQEFPGFKSTGVFTFAPGQQCYLLTPSHIFLLSCSKRELELHDSYGFIRDRWPDVCCITAQDA